MAQICKKWEKYNHESIYHNIAYNGERSEITKFRLSLIDNLLNKVWEYKKTDYFIPIKIFCIYIFNGMKRCPCSIVKWKILL